MPSSQPAFRSSQPHIHVGTQTCPTCEQEIPNDKAEQIRARLQAREQELSAAATARAASQFAQDKARIEANAKSAMDALNAQITGREAKARADGAKAAQTEVQEKLASLEQAKQAAEAAKTSVEKAAAERVTAAEAAKIAAQAEAKTAKENHETILNARLQEQREAMEKDKASAVNKQAASDFEEKQKLRSMVQDLQRRLEKQTADQLGEGAEIDLFDDLTEEFPHDRIERVGRGLPGADIKHTVMHNDKEAGVIVYDSKNRNAWRNDYVEKLASDQKAARADHAILAALKFPANAQQLHLQDGVIVANPKRVVAIATMLRQHLLHIHSLRLGGADRAKKTAKLYEFMTSKRCVQLLTAIDTTAEDLLDLQAKEKRAHDATWKRQGTLLRSIQKNRADLCNEIDQIIEAD